MGSRLTKAGGKPDLGTILLLLVINMSLSVFTLGYCETVTDAKVIIDTSHSGQTLEIRLGNVLLLSLSEFETSKSWDVSFEPTVIEKIMDQDAGGNGLLFKAVGAGTTQLLVQQKFTGDLPGPNLMKFEYYIRVVSE